MGLSASEIKTIRSLQQKKFRKEQNLFVVEGVKSVQELLSSDLETDCIYTTDESLIEQEAVRVVPISEKELERISGFKTPNKMLALVRIPPQKEPNWSCKVLLMLDGVGDPGNLGTIIRTARWFGVTSIFCSPDCADVWDRKTVQSTMGALFHVDVRYGDLQIHIKEAKEHGFTILGASMDGKPVQGLSAPEKSVLVMGSESHGISPEVMLSCDEQITIPNREQIRHVESLNAAVATSVILYELTRTN